MQFYIAGKRSNGTSSFIIPLLMKIRKCILVIFLYISLFLFNNVTCWTCIKRIPFRAKIMYIAHNSVSMACDRNMCILVMVWSQYHSPSKDAVLLLPNACCPSFFSVSSELMMGERLKVNDIKLIMLIIKQKHLILKLVNH